MEEYEEIFEFNELAQGYYKIEDPKMIPTYTELIAACSSSTFKSIKYVEDALKSRKGEIFPDRVSFEDEVKDVTIEESKISEKTILADTKSENDLAVPESKGFIQIGKLETVQHETIREDDKASSNSYLRPISPSTDYSGTSRLTKLTPLMVAAMNKNYKTGKLLIEHASKVRKWNKIQMSMFINMQLVDRLGGNNPLLFAGEEGDYILGEYLIKGGADINVVNSQRQTCLIVSSKRNYLNIIHLLLENKNIDILKEDKNCMNAFSLACTLGNEEVVDIFLSYRIRGEKSGKPVFNIDGRDKLNLTPLMKAATFGFYNIVLKLLKFGANPRLKNNNGESALALSGMQENHKIGEKLIMAKADVNEIDLTKRTPLLKAARHNNDYSILELLLKNGAKTDIADDMGNTPLHHAAIRGSEIVADFLLKLGANPYAKNKEGQVPYELCKDKGRMAFQVCSVCLKKATVSCKHGIVMKYCSVDCAKKSWPDHKKLCHTFQKEKEAEKVKDK